MGSRSCLLPALALAVVAACTDAPSTTTVTAAAEAGPPPAPAYSRTLLDAITGALTPIEVAGTSANCAAAVPCFVPEAGADSYARDQYERPTGQGAGAATYYPAIDIVSADLGVQPAWLFYRLNLAGPDAGLPGSATSLPYFYAVEVNFDADPRGDATIELAAPSISLGNNWSTAGVVVRSDGNASVGGPRPLVADGPSQAGGGYERADFASGTNTAPGARGGSTAVQARVRGNAIEVAVFRPFLESLTTDAVTGAAFRAYAARSGLDVSRLYVHDDKHRTGVGSPYPWLATAGAPSTCPVGANGDDGLTTTQLASLESGTRIDTGIANPCYASGTVTELDNAGTVTSLADRADVTFDVDLRLDKAGAPAPVVVGGTLTYTLTITNASSGAGQATNIVATDALPAGVTFASASTGCSHASGTVTCLIGTLANGASTSVAIVVVPTAVGTLVNTATVISDGDELTPADNVDSTTTIVQPPQPTCPNGIVDAGEVCDDGNTTPADGCEVDCKRSLGAVCDDDAQCSSGACDELGSDTCEPANACGNGRVDANESCDDGGTTPGDGCDAACKREDGAPCSGGAECASGVCELVCGGRDTDGDGARDTVDLDDDNDGLLDAAESGDRDLDGVPDARDLDSDNDGLADALEAGGADGNGDAIVDCAGHGANGFCDALETSAESGIAKLALIDSDRDGSPDVRDLDSDNDGLSDLVEAGTRCSDANDDAVCDHGADRDRDGIADAADHLEGFGNAAAPPATSSDADGTPDVRDLDSDADSLLDVAESKHAALDGDKDGILDATSDADRDGVRDVLDAAPGAFGGLRDARTDIDSDTVPDFQDPDGDGDGAGSDDNCATVANANQRDVDGDGIGDSCDDLDDRYGVAGGGCSTGSGAPGALVVVLVLVLMTRRRCAHVAMLLVLGLPVAARAQVIEGELSVERFQLASDSDGILDVEGGRAREHLALDLALWLGYANDPLTVYRSTGDGRERFGALVANQVGGELSGALGLFGRLQLGVALPLVLSQSDDIDDRGGVAPMAPGSSFAVGDLRFLLKAQLVKGGVDVALVGTLTAPTSSGDGFVGDGGATIAPALVIARTAARVRFAANLGYRARGERMTGNLAVDDELFASAGVAFPARPLELELAFSYATAADDAFGAFERNYAEIKPGLAVDIGPVRAFVAGGMGVAEGFGTPDWRVLAGIRVDRALVPERRPIPRPVTVVVPPPDVDGDRIVDDADKCPNEAEDVDAFQDEDGCPDTDNDHDQVADANDRCPLAVEDLDGFEDHDGCPDADNDQDGLVDREDTCPLVAGPIDNRGCAWPDRDRDGIADKHDNCPDWAGKPAFHGCNGPQLVRITETRLELLHTVAFATGRSRIARKSRRILDAAALVLKNHRELHIEIGGHSDDRGSEALNLELSAGRARAVKAYFMKKGVPAERLTSKGYGETRPVADNSTGAGRGKNRRVELVIARSVTTQAPAAGSGQ